MAKLTAGMRAKLPGKVFAGPGRSFPIPDKGHARAALQDAPKGVKAGSITPSEASSIKAKASAKLGKSVAGTDPSKSLHRQP